MTVPLIDDGVRTALARNYLIEREIGAGGFATVYLARDLKHDRPIALKVLRPEVSATASAERFFREIRISANLTHPHLVPLHDSGEAEGLLYFVMPFADGGSLRQRLQHEHQLPIDEGIRIACEVGEGLACAHRHGVVHRDVKPGNILFIEGHAAVTDFGIARALDPVAAGHRTAGGVTLGTPEYMSPEACAGDDEVTALADQYSLGCVVYEMLAGEPPFRAASVLGVMARHLTDTPPPLLTVRPEVPPPVAEAISRALSKNPADRFPSVAAFVEALRSGGEAGSATTSRAVAVLPFINVGGLPEDDALCDGVTEDIIAALTRVAELRVASRTSVYALRREQLDIRAVGAKLNVGSVLEGSVQRAGGRLRISVQLVSAVDGYLLWSERFDRELSDVFAIQDEIAQQVARALKVILREDAPHVARVHTTDVRAYEYYLRGRQYFRQTRRKSLQFAREMFERAIALDPHFALAWAGVADASSLLHMYYPGPGADLDQADAASARALQLDPGLPEVHAARGFALWRLHREPEAIAAFEGAMALDPKEFEARYFCARLYVQKGEMAKAAELFEDAARAREDYQARYFAAQAYTSLGRPAEAEAAYRRALHVVAEHLAMNPDDPRAATMRAVSLCRLGRFDEGFTWARRALEIDPDDAGVLYNVACLYALEGKHDEALDCLDRVVQMGLGDRSWIEHDPDLDSLRHLPRFQALLWRE